MLNIAAVAVTRATDKIYTLYISYALFFLFRIFETITIKVFYRVLIKSVSSSLEVPLILSSCSSFYST